MVLSIAVVLSAAGPAAAQQAPNSSQDSAAAELARLHDSLHLSLAQERAWKDYVASTGPNQQADQRRRAAEELMPNLPTPRRVALMESSMAADEADFRQQGAAVVAFYNQLTPSQQKVFDQQTLPRTGS
jgi:hypothetical protein